MQSANVALESVVRNLDVNDTGSFYVGRVTRAGAGTYDVTVRSPGGPELTCLLASQLVCYYYGVSDCAIPIEGTRVVVQVPRKASKYGVIVGVLPSADLGSSINPDTDAPPEMFIHLMDLESSATSVTELAYRTPLENPEDTNILNAHAGRPLDIMPGNRAWINEQGVQIALLNLLASLHASDRAKIEVSLIDDLVRIVSGHYRHIHCQGEDQIYNDGGMLTRELKINSYQCEKSGFRDYASPLFTDSGKKDDQLKKSNEALYQMVQESIASWDRLQIYLVYLGDLVNVFISSPPPGDSPNTSDADTVNRGLMHAHVDSSGRLGVRSAGGISLERYDRIPIPKKKHEPWDPAGDKMVDIEPGAKVAPVFDSNHPYGRSLQLRDAQAWRTKLALQRLNEQSQAADRKDYFLPEESQIPVPEDEYDSPGNAQADFAANDMRRAGIHIEDDGSVIITDAWGSELIMRGGNIVLNCAGQIEARSGKSIVQLAGHDIIAKARKSLDLTATDNDVRVKANRNLQMVSEGRDGIGGGILLESKSTSDSASYQGKGEQARGSGIVFKAANSRVFMQGRTVHMNARQRLIMEGFDADGETRNSQLLISFGALAASVVNDAIISADDNAGLLISRGVAMLAGDSAYVAGGNSLVLTRDAKMWLPMQEADMDRDIYKEKAQPRIEEIYQTIQDNTSWLGSYAPANVDDIEFTYRSSAEYGTLTGTEVKNATKFYVYEASWAYMLRKGSSMIDGELEEWQESEISDTYPWPGKVAYETECYVILDVESNILSGATGVAKNRKDMKSALGTLRPISFHEYEVLKS